MREIPLTHGYVTWVSDEDYPRVVGLRWWAVVDGGRVYAQTKIGRKNVYLHRLLMQPDSGLKVDHKHGTNPVPDRPDVVDNRRGNLRVCTQSQNGAGHRTSCRERSSQFRGVTWKVVTGRWQAKICAGGEDRHLGYFDYERDAARAYDDAAKEHFGDFAQLNFPE